MSELSAFLDGEPLSSVNKDLLKISAKLLQDFLRKHPIKQIISANEAERLTAQNPNYVFCTISTESKVVYELTSGTTSALVVTQLCSEVNPDENTLEYFLTDHPYQAEDATWLDIEFMLSCDACLEEKQEFVEAECDTCGREDGNLMYALVWDQSGNVTIDRLDPEDF